MDKERWNKLIQIENIEETWHGYDVERISQLHFLKEHIEFNKRKVLDVGCGNGTILDFLEKNLEIEAFGLTMNKTNFGNITQGDMHEMPFDNESFDIVLIFHTLEHSIAPYIVLTEINRVLKKNGIIAIISPEEGDIWTTTFGHYSVMTFRQIFNLLHKSGFEEVRNMRYEYTQSEFEERRDMILVWKKTSEPHKVNLNDKLYFIPIFSQGFMFNNRIKIRYVKAYKTKSEEILLSRTDNKIRELID